MDMPIHNPELGYTPENLRKLLEQNNLSHQELRAVIGKARNTFGRYICDVDNPNHVTMSHEHWLQLLEYVKNK